MATHRIRLRGPWELAWIAAVSDGTRTSVKSVESKRIRLPARWSDLFGDRSGHARLSRRFHKPTNLDSHDEVTLVVESMPGRWTVALNECVLTLSDEQLGSTHYNSPRAVVTALLESTNVLTMELDVDSATMRENHGGPWGEVALEIRGR